MFNVTVELRKFDWGYWRIVDALKASEIVQQAKWQSVKMPMPMREISLLLEVILNEYTCPEILANWIKPNLPWADKHFLEERVSGYPINPGQTWRIWPWTRSADTHRREGEEDPQFDHSYAERYWPKMAGLTSTGMPDGKTTGKVGLTGVRFDIGDLEDMIQIMVDDPMTRQAYLPIFYPEDLTAARLGKRIPCTLGYHFMMRNNKLDITYFMRSCDINAHFRDDVYLTARLLLWVLDQLRLHDPRWQEVSPGSLKMHVVSMHGVAGFVDGLKETEIVE